MANLVIDGDIKQKMLPFVCNPGKTQQSFSFREDNAKSKGSLINMCPWSYKAFMNKDIGNMMIFNQNGKSVTYTDILNSIPGIQIREFLPDTALDLAINFFTDTIKQITSLTKSTTPPTTGENNSPAKNEEDTGFFAKMKNVAMWFVKYVTGAEGADPNLAKTVANSLEKMPGYVDDMSKKMILQIPYMMYYLLQSCQNTATYELPCIQEDRVLYSSDGAPGWAGEKDGFKFSANIPMYNVIKNTFVGSMIDKLFGNIAISYMPFWNADTGTGAVDSPVVVKFDLFNDTADAAMANFLFVHSIIPSNKWIQYGLFQHAPALYDIKLEGYNRLFACTGNFKVTYQGVLRDPPDSWILNLLSSHLNTCAKSLSYALIRNNNLIKIPDIYHVEMTFTSIFPVSFNTWLFNYACNDNIITKTFDPHVPSKMSEITGKVVGEVINGIKNNWK